ncbi:hypothetical protein FA15DRAFT_224648 [Coprinopsis marcescibilis]|uniref:Uncharacterized protein n=1 Tax=Coprinopsis marcescibilis TaxID=230819 RepID=A0A5C3KFW6_COPMA|nr:hypothetical protein FA15DRAFT_224648 [Coprinopsis marcescibilis]
MQRYNNSTTNNNNNNNTAHEMTSRTDPSACALLPPSDPRMDLTTCSGTYARPV